ncbi:MAG: hypothetical protein A2Z42_00575 [Candidatus Woykebacteria bacterium RBG_19FT_COMBO_43_10]|uniref:Type 4 fimbrial biogenesis protein PilX N-terminal domain-containing protein n=1 Tax=Candidatus Woykebacteria bacterium RBG_19FT_COMBO_43_10 TaxID=1802598 RepID=A0A1G1WKZ7_9BACT|nr:MAG: hypothetical protein A2Z42_00575 [Candidatus Woykebacteria bacterium RBG_19FT_COMBO_43_10]
MKEKGQALIILIVAVALTLSVLTASLLASISQARASSTSRLGQKVYYAAESGAEYGLLKSLRNPGSCTGSDTLNQDSVSVTITYNSAGTSCVVTSEATQNNILKKIRVENSYTPSQIFTTCCWSEIP